MQQAPDETLVDQALSLIATAEIATERSARKAAARLAAWRNRGAAQELAYHEAVRRWQMLGAVAPDMRERFRQDVPHNPAPGLSRRTVLGLGVAGACTALLGTGWYWRQPLYRETHATGPGRLAYAEVPDRDSGDGRGTRIDLNADTRLEVRLYRGERVAALERGEALFTVSPDPARPFRVHTRAGVIEVVGTVFTVSDRGGPVSVSVQEGHVRFSPAPRETRWSMLQRGGPAVDLYANQAVTWREGQLEPVRGIEPDSVAAWRNGWLWFDNQTLDEALPAFNAYRSRPLLPASRDVGMLRLTGRFRSADADHVAAQLEAALPVQAHTRASGAVELRRR